MNTGNYSLLRYNPTLIKRAVSISLTSPDWVKVKELKELMPTWGLLRAFRENKIDEAGYISFYRRQLDWLNPETIKEKLYSLTGGEEPILMCWCGHNDFCHRHLAAEWIEETMGIKVSEFSKKKFVRENGRLSEWKQEEQISLMF